MPAAMLQKPPWKRASQHPPPIPTLGGWGSPNTCIGCKEEVGERGKR